MTILEKIWLVWRCTRPFLYALVVVAGVLIATREIRRSAHPFSGDPRYGLITGLMIVFGTVFAIRGVFKTPSAGVIRDMLLRAEGYWLLFIANQRGVIRTIGPLTTAAKNTILKESTNEVGLYFLVCLNANEDGMVFVGENTPQRDVIQGQLGWWKVRPVHLCSYFSDKEKVSIRLVDKDGHESFPVSISEAACFIRSARIGWLAEECNSLRGASNAILNNQKPFSDDTV